MRFKIEIMADDVTCMNCNGIILNGDRYCSHCGAQIIAKRLNSRQVFDNVVKDLLEWDKGFFKTFIDLSFRPEKVIRFYIEGGRKKYLNPVKYLIICFIVLQILNLFGIEISFIISGMSGFVSGFESTSEQTLNLAIKEKLDQLADINSALMLLTIPFVSLITKLMYHLKQYNYTEHLVINIYLFIQMFMVTTLVVVPFQIPGQSPLLLFILSYLYVYYFLYRVFSQSIISTALKTIIYLTLSLFASILIWGLIGIIWIKLF